MGRAQLIAEWSQFERALFAHVEAQEKVGAKIPREACGLRALQALSRDARAYARIQERYCNEDMSDETRARLEAREARIEERFRAFGATIRASVTFGGDPRGYTVKLGFIGEDGEARGNTWGGAADGWGFPGS